MGSLHGWRCRRPEANSILSSWELSRALNLAPTPWKWSIETLASSMLTPVAPAEGDQVAQLQGLLQTLWREIEVA